MILQELAGLARREGLVEDPDYEPKPVRWTIAIGSGGKFLGTLLEVSEDDHGKSRPKVRQVPRSPVRTSGSAANFLVDKAEYALGFDPDDNPKKLKKLAIHRAMFVEYVESALVLAPGDPGLLALLAFLRDDSSVSAAVEEVRGRAAANDLFAFRYRDGDDIAMVHDRDAVRAAWKTLRHPSSPGEVHRAECLVCGVKSIPVGHPMVKRVPGGSTSGISFTSANAPAFESYGLEGNQSTPICRSCADSYGTALNRLFHPQYTAPNGDLLNRRSFKLADDTAVIYWASGAAEHSFVNELGDLEFYDADHAGRLFAAVHSGKSVTLDDPTPFHALVVSGAQGRATIRRYYQTTVGKLAGNLQLYFEDIHVVKRFPNSPDHPALSWLVRSLAPQGKYENVTPDLAGRLIVAIFDGSPFPTSVLAAAIGRIRSEPENPNKGQAKHTRERMALIRATLNRQLRPRHADQPDAASPRIRSLITREITPMLDPSCKNNAYCLGRLFAVLEKLQADAIGSPGSTITDRFYGAASATPAAVFASLLRKAQHHTAKLGGVFYPKMIQEILDLLEPGNAFPTTLGLEEQGLFALGFYHQKASLWRGKEKGKLGPEGEAEAPSDAA